MTKYPGLDYSLGQGNVNHEAGISYGVISQASVLQAWCDSSEAIYSNEPNPDCEDRQKLNQLCDSCNEFSEPIGYEYFGDGYELMDCLDTDIMVIESPYFTYAQYCSPCVPGAGNLDSPMDEPETGVKCYCLGHDWFEDNRAPYPVYRVSDSTLVHPE